MTECSVISVLWYAALLFCCRNFLLDYITDRHIGGHIRFREIVVIGLRGLAGKYILNHMLMCL